MIEKTVWQDEKDFTLDVPVNLKNDRVYGKGTKSDVPVENLFASTNKMSRKFMISAAISWYGATKPFLENDNGITVNKENYCITSSLIFAKFDLSANQRSLKRNSFILMVQIEFGQKL